MTIARVIVYCGFGASLVGHAASAEGTAAFCFSTTLPAVGDAEMSSAPAGWVFINNSEEEVNVRCEFQSHPAVSLVGIELSVGAIAPEGGKPARLRTNRGAEDSVSCALLTRTSNRGQAYGRRIAQAEGGTLHLSVDTARVPGFEHEDSRFHYLDCAVPARAGIRSIVPHSRRHVLCVAEDEALRGLRRPSGFIALEDGRRREK